MILIVVALSATIFAFATNSFGQFSSNFQMVFSGSASTLTEKLVIEQIVFNVTGGALGANIYVRDVGQAAASIAAVYITLVSSNSILLNDQLSPAKNVNPGNFIDLAVSFTPTVGTVYYFTVAAQNGNTVGANAQAP